MGLVIWEDFLRWFLPLGNFEDIRDDIRRLFEEVYREHPVIRMHFASQPVSKMQYTAVSRAKKAREYNPNHPVENLKSAISGLYTILEVVILAVFVVGIISGASFLVWISRVGLELLSSVQSILISIILGGPAILGIAAALLLIWLKLISASPVIVQTFNQELVIGPKDIVRIDSKPELGGIIVWNGSLVGTSALKLVNIFSILYILSAVPGWDPYGFIQGVLRDNMDVFVQVDDWWEAVKVLLRRFR